MKHLMLFPFILGKNDHSYQFLAKSVSNKIIRVLLVNAEKVYKNPNVDLLFSEVEFSENQK